MLVGSNVVSAILTGNQAEGGFRVKNLAGKRTQAALNEDDTLEWSKEALLNYAITIGKGGDGRYLEQWHGAENAQRPFRWSSAVSLLRLPVAPGVRYTLTLEFQAPKQAVSPEAGLYFQGRQIAKLEEASALKAELPPSTESSIEVELRSKGWMPVQFMPGSGDNRTLGVMGHRIKMQAAGAGTRVFNANNGTWMASLD